MGSKVDRCAPGGGGRTGRPGTDDPWRYPAQAHPVRDQRRGPGDRGHRRLRHFRADRSRGGGECGTGEQPVHRLRVCRPVLRRNGLDGPISGRAYTLGASTVAIDRGDLRRAKARRAGDGRPGRHPVAAGALVRGHRCRVPSRASSRMQPRRSNRLPQRAGRRREAL